MRGCRRVATLAGHLTKAPWLAPACVAQAAIPRGDNNRAGSLTTRPRAQHSILSREMGVHQWYLELRREAGADLGHIKRTLQELRQQCAGTGVTLTLAFGPSLLKDVTKDFPADFAPYTPFIATDGSAKEACATQDELLIWMHSDMRDHIWKAQFEMREKMKGQMLVMRETPTFIYGESLDMSGFADGLGNPEPADRDEEVAVIPAGLPGAGGSFVIAQRWIHDLSGFGQLSRRDQENMFGRTRADREENASVEIPEAPVNSHVKKMQLRDPNGKIDEITRRSTPYSMPAPKEGADGINGLFFIGFCRTQAPLIDRMESMYGMDGSMRDRMTDFTYAASGSFYFAPSLAVLDSL